MHLLKPFIIAFSEPNRSFTMYSGLNVTSRLQYHISRLILGLHAPFSRVSGGFAAFFIFSALYGCLASIVLPRSGLAGTTITSPSLALGCSGDFLQILAFISVVLAC